MPIEASLARALPATVGDHRPSHRPGERRHEPAQARRVLVVDDNRDAADTLCTLLRAMGADARATYDGPTALAIIRAERPHTVLLDLGMPGMDGYEVARLVRSDGELRNISLVALTGWGQDEDRRRSREAGFDMHLVKPAAHDELRNLLSASPAAASTGA
ncbi:MAG TPA: response regulator [Pirellulales bacterium]